MKELKSLSTLISQIMNRLTFDRLVIYTTIKLEKLG